MTFDTNKDLTAYNTFKISVAAQNFAVFSSIDELIELLKITDVQENNFILGGGSNIVFLKNIMGYTLYNQIKGIQIVKEDDTNIWIEAGGGMLWNDLVSYCVERNYGGIENLTLIPGSVGAAPIQNIGAYGVELADVFDSLKAISKETLATQVFDKNACAFGYRDSVFKNKLKNEFVITSVTLCLTKNPTTFNTNYASLQEQLTKDNVTQLSVQAISKAVKEVRESKLPNPQQLGNAGSFFKNPICSQTQLNALQKNYPNIVWYATENADQVKLAAGWLIDSCGWKGFKEGNVGCYEKQALVLVNYGKATGHEVNELSNAILQSVQHKFDISLEREVNIVPEPIF